MGLLPIAAVSNAPTISARATKKASSSPSSVPSHRPSCASTNARPSSVADWLNSAAKAARTLGAQEAPVPPSGEAARVTTCGFQVGGDEEGRAGSVRPG